MQKGLSVAELLMLDFLSYASFKYLLSCNKLSVGDLANYILSEIQKGARLYNPAMTTPEEWKIVCCLVLSDSKLSHYRITRVFRKDDVVVFAAVNRRFRPTDVNVIFRGTSSASGWNNNAISSSIADTPDQLISLKYIRSLPLSYGRKLTLSGHSKGGNQSAYATICSNRVKRAVTFDSQGFSREFITKYYKEISTRAKRITAISAANDFVHSLLIHPIGVRHKFIKTKRAKGMSFYHKPNILLDNNGKLKPYTKEGVGPKYFHKLSLGIMELDSSKQRQIAYTLLNIFKSDMVGKPDHKNSVQDIKDMVSNIPDLVKAMAKIKTNQQRDNHKSQ